MDKTALGQAWIRAATRALKSPVLVETPLRDAFYLDENKADAIGYRFFGHRGEKIEIDIDIESEVSSSDTVLLFIDLFRIEDDSLGLTRHIATAEPRELRMEFEPRRDADYVLRFQPELLLGGKFIVSIRKVPAFTFPVSGKNSRAIGSFFGDPRDGGKRDHHGVDIFAKRHTPIVSPVKGYVRRVNERGLGGKVVWIYDSKRRQNLYFAHLQEQLVKPRTEVNPGDTIGTVGNSGNARTTAPHLHFGIYKNGPIDPYYFIKEGEPEPDSITADLSWLGNMVSLSSEDSINWQILGISNHRCRLYSKERGGIEIPIPDLRKHLEAYRIGVAAD